MSWSARSLPVARIAPFFALPMPHVAADIEMRLLLEAVYAKYSHDFRDYSGASLKRRVQHAFFSRRTGPASAGA